MDSWNHLNDFKCIIIIDKHDEGRNVKTDFNWQESFHKLEQSSNPMYSCKNTY